jgi:MFS transporter, ACS family, glucarate transporter
MQESAPRHERPTNVRYAVLAVFCTLTFLTYLDRICIMRTQEDIARDLQFGELDTGDDEALGREGQTISEDDRQTLSTARARQRMGWVFSAFAWGYVLFEIPGGWLGDTWGPRSVIARIVVWWSVFTALTGSVSEIARSFTPAPSPALLLILMVSVRFLFGAGEAGAYPNISRALARWFPYEERASIQGIVWFTSRLGGALSPAIIGALMSVTGDWHRAFWALGIVGVVWAVSFSWWFRDRPEQMHGVNSAEANLIRGPMIKGGIYDENSEGKLPWRRLATSLNVWALCLASAATSFCWYFYITFSPAYLKDRFGIDYGDSEVMSGLPLLVGGVACLVGGRFSDLLVRRTRSRRWGRSLLGAIGLCGAAACSLGVTQLPTASLVIAAMCIGSWLQDMTVPCLWSAAVDVGGRYAGTMCGVMNACGAVGGALSPLVIPGIASKYGWSAVFVLFSAVYLAGGLAWLRIDAEERLALGTSPIAKSP